jgi:hypothetical protein
MAADEMQVRLSAKDDLTRELKNATKQIAKLESQLRDLDGATGPEAERDIRRLTTQLDKAYDKSKVLSGAVGKLDEDLDQMGYSAKRAGDKTQAMSRDIDDSRRKSKAFAAGWGKMVGVVAGVTAAIGAASGAFQLLGNSINEARSARKAMAQTAAVMKSMGRTEAPKRINKMIDQLSSMSGIDDDALREMTNVMLTFGNVQGKTFEKANGLALDLSVAFGKDLQSSAVMVGKALNDPTKGLTALTRVGVSFTKEQQEQVKAMMEVGDLAGAQKIILGELTRQVKGSAEAQADGVGKAQVAWGNLQEAIGETLLSVGTGTGMDLAGMLKEATKWIKRHKEEIVSVLQTIISVVFKLISVFLKWQSIILKTFGYLFGAMATTLGVLANFGLVSQDTADNVKALADGFGEASEKADTASKWFDNASKSFSTAAGDADRLKDKLKAIGVEVDNLNGKKVKRLLDNNRVPGVNSQGGVPVGGDTTVAMGTGSLGAAGLAAAHAGYSSALGGHSILSGVRGSNLGSAQSDHLRGRAMDIRGPRLGAYAQVVRRSGGYAAMHGSGANRHLHVVPQTRRPAPQMAGGNTFHADVTVVNPAGEMDIQGAVARGLRQAARQTKERG